DASALARETQARSAEPERVDTVGLEGKRLTAAAMHEQLPLTHGQTVRRFQLGTVVFTCERTELLGARLPARLRRSAPPRRCHRCLGGLHERPEIHLRNLTRERGGIRAGEIAEARDRQMLLRESQQLRTVPGPGAAVAHGAKPPMRRDGETERIGLLAAVVEDCRRLHCRERSGTANLA